MGLADRQQRQAGEHHAWSNTTVEFGAGEYAGKSLLGQDRGLLPEDQRISVNTMVCLRKTKGCLCSGQHLFRCSFTLHQPKSAVASGIRCSRCKADDQQKSHVRKVDSQLLTPQHIRHRLWRGMRDTAVVQQVPKIRTSTHRPQQTFSGSCCRAAGGLDVMRRLDLQRPEF